jgi:hypothetical protein
MLWTSTQNWEVRSRMLSLSHRGTGAVQPMLTSKPLIIVLGGARSVLGAANRKWSTVAEQPRSSATSW